MPLEAVMILLDNSEFCRNGDYSPSRLDAQNEAAQLIAGAKTQGNAETVTQFFGHRGLTRKDAAEFYGPDTITYLFETMKEDDISAIRDEGRTINVFKLIQKVNQKAETFDEAQFRIRTIIENQKREDNRRTLRAHLTKSAYVWPADLFAASK